VRTCVHRVSARTCMNICVCTVFLKKDVFHWNLHQHGQFTVHSMYLVLINNGFVDTNWKLWKV
jgi:hypothetical protein